MKFTDYIGTLAKENMSLKLATTLLGLVTLSQGAMLLKYSFQEPLVIERGIETKIMSRGSNERTPLEIENFVRVALAQRFNSRESPNLLYLSYPEMQFREKEQKELQDKAISQSIVINEIKIKNGIVRVNADRLMSVKEIRSAFKFPLVLELSSTVRSLTNPYGLILSKVEEDKQAAEEKSQ